MSTSLRVCPYRHPLASPLTTSLSVALNDIQSVGCERSQPARNPNQRPQILLMWGGRRASRLGSPWDGFGKSSNRIFLQQLDKCHCGKAKSHIRPDAAKKQRWKCGLELWLSETKQRDSERIRSPSFCSQQSKHWCQTLNRTWVTVFEARVCANRRIGNPFPPSICADLDLQTPPPIPNMAPAITNACVNVYPSHHSQALKPTSTNPFLIKNKGSNLSGVNPFSDIFSFRRLTNYQYQYWKAKT